MRQLGSSHTSQSFRVAGRLRVNEEDGVTYLAGWPGMESRAMGWKDMGSEMSHSRHWPFSCAVRSCHMLRSMPLPGFSGSVEADAPLRWAEADDSSGGEASSGVRWVTFTNCGITLMALAAPTQVASV